MRLLSKILFVCLLLLSQRAAFADDPKGHNSGASASAEPPAPGQPTTQLDFQTDLFTGRFGYTVPMTLSPGRHGSTPNVTLHYTSGGDNSWCGVGWDLDLGYIERDTRYGVPVKWGADGRASSVYDDTKGFVFSLNGRSSHLVSTGNGVYRADIESGFLKFQLTAQNYWLVTDKSGNQFYFGQSNTTRVVNSHWGGSTATTTFKWALDKIVTVNNDVSGISYTTVSNKLYPLKLSYNGNTSGTPQPNFTVDFNIVDRPDSKISAKSGFVVTQTKRLDSIVHKVNGSLVWSNKLNYILSSANSRSLLASVTRFGTDQTTPYPTYSFSYQQQQFGFTNSFHWDNLFMAPTSENNTNYFGVTGVNVDIADMDGDGLPDRLVSPVPLDTVYQTNWWVQLNSGSGLSAATTWGPLAWQTYSNLSTYNRPLWSPPQSSQGRLVDINGDGKPDRVFDPMDSLYNWGNASAMKTNYDRFFVQLNGSTNLAAANSWGGLEDQVMGAGTVGTTANYRAVENSQYVVMLDMNGDGLPDRVMTDVRIGSVPITEYLVQFNTGSGFGITNNFVFSGEADSRWQGLTAPSDLDNAQSYMRLIDINGDGLPDRVMLNHPTNNQTGPYAATAQTSYTVELNNGCGFEPAMTWTNVDPCTNLTQASGAHWPGYMDVGDSYQVVLRDINGDGLPDRVLLPQTASYTNWLVQLNTGAGFANVTNWGAMEYQGVSSSRDFAGIQTSKSLLLDVNGDGLPDRVMSKVNPLITDKYWLVQLSKGPFPDLMTVANNGIGGSVAINYRASTAYDNHDQLNGTGRQLLPFPQWTVSALVEKDGINPGTTNSYNYEGGMWGFDRREFNGFAKVTAIDPLGASNVHYFHQSGGRDYSSLGEYSDNASNFAKKGMEYRTDTFGSDGLLYRTVFNKIEEMVLDSGVRHFAYVTNTITKDYNSPGSSGYRARAKQFFYDNNGNLTQQIDYGEVTGVTLPMTASLPFTGTGSVYRKTVIATLTNANIVDKPSQELLASDSGFATVLRETTYLYDGSTGNPTQIKSRICSGSYAVTTNGYDGYNNLHTEDAPDGVRTETLYDQTYFTYPATQIVGSKLTSTFTYDPKSGKLSESVSPAGLVTHFFYDPLLRLNGTAISPVANGSPTLWTTTNWYQLNGMAADGTSQNYVQSRRNDDLGGHDTWAYSDGLGRSIQVRVEAETANYFRVQDSVYDRRGAALFSSLPYLTTGTGNSTPASKLGTLFQYDPIGRLTTTTAAELASYNLRVFNGTTAKSDTGSPVGSAQIAYYDGTNPWVIVKTDEAASVIKYCIDGLGRTNQVIEVNGGNFTTTYSYDAAGALTNIADCLANNFKYALNNQGQVVAMADPDMGTWSYTRDTAGRVTEQDDANGQRVVFHYSDAVGRVSSRDVYDFKNNLVYTVSYVYDSNGGDSAFTVYPGQLYKEIDKEGWVKHGYDYRGRETNTCRYISRSGKTYTTQVVFDNMDRIVSTVYPNGGGTATVIYDAGMNITNVTHGGTNIYRVTGFDDVGHLKGVITGNGVTTSYTYYDNSQRLKNILTTGLQNLTYTYDQVSDVLTISDSQNPSGSASATISATSYDSLHRLKSITRPTGTYSFSYDAIGNLISNTEATNAATYTYGTRIPHAVRTANGKTTAYDLNGNMLVRGTQHLEYDPENHLTLVRTPASTTTFGYGGDGGRLWKQASTTNGLQVWIGNIYEEKNGKTLFHIYAGDRLVCTLDAAGTVVDYYQSDNLHSSTVISGSTGAQTQHYEYTAYGQDRYTLDSTLFPVTRRFTSQSKDDETGLYYYGGQNGRYYDPELGRFIQPDDEIPALFNPQCLNRYSYCLGNPLRYTDPRGHAYWEDVGNMWMGYYDAGAGLVGGTLSMVAHPINTASGIATAVSHPLATGQAIVNSVSEDWDSGARGQGRVVGNALLAVGAALSGGAAETGNLSKASEIANVGSKLERTEGLVTGPCFVAGTAIAIENGSQPIEALHVGDRVMTPNQPSVLAEIDSANLTKWRKISLRMPNPECPNDTIDLQLLRSIEWFDSLSLSEDGRIWLDIGEVGLHGWAEVAVVEPCPPIQAGAGRVITGTITHLNSFVMVVRLVGQKQILEPTDRHRLFSVTRNDWVPAGQLQVGEELATRTGTATVESVEARPGTHRVYNIEVEAEHCFYAGDARVLSHNACSLTGKELAGKTRTEIRDLAKQKGLDPAGDPAHPDYPRKFKEPTGEERIRLDRGHKDPKTGQPYNNPKAAADHVHGYEQNGSKILHEGDPHIPTTGE